MTQEEVRTEPQPGDIDVVQEWDQMDAGQKSRAMRTLHEDQQKLVVELGRQMMEKEVEIAMALTKARTAAELNQDDRKTLIVEQELKPKRAELEKLRQEARAAREILDTYERLGKGII